MPKNNIGYSYCVLTLLLSAILNALIFGDVASLIVSLKKNENAISADFDRNNRIMNEYKLSLDLKI